MSCKWCESDLCTYCLAVEIHECVNIKQMKEYILKKLEEDLNKQKTISPKVLKI